MIRILSISKIVTLIAVIYATLTIVCSAALAQFGAESWEVEAVIGFALSGAAVLEVVLMVLIYVGWRWLWRSFPVLNQWVYPDIDGEWKITINWQKEGENGTVEAKAFIKQDFLRISMEVISNRSESETLIAEPRKDQESGKPLLYYVYRVTPLQISEEAGLQYFGAAKLRVFESNGEELRGNYWTSKQTKGHFRLFRQAK